ncbi:MAG: trypsin-like peptidase domain-containing protein [Firmicutes bacterium]|nr:trypsin-like peptidase domain-containing protein [Bacillota bacterium]
MAMYRIKERHIENREYDESNYWMEMRPSQRAAADLDEYARLNELADEAPDAPLKNRNPWRRSKLIWLLAALAVLSFVSWSFRDYIFGEKMDFSLIAHSNRLAREESLAALKNAVVSIECAGRSGTGFNISPNGLIVTNAHVISGGDYVTLFFPSGEQRVYVAHDVMEIEGVDLALVDIDGEDLPSVELADYLPEAGQEVIFIGNPLGYDWTISEGTVTGMAYIDDTQVICLDGPVHPGSSGSPVFDGESRVIGVIFAKLTQEDGVGLAIPISYLTDYMSDR